MGRDGKSPLRTHVAYAKGGHEPPIWEEGLAPCLELARLHLDVCFYLPPP